jgi:hypothetical protein
MGRSASKTLAWTCLLLALMAALLMPGAALAAGESVEGGSSLSELQQKAEEPETETTTTATTATSEGETGEPKNSDKTLVLVLGAAVVLLSAITFVIVRDARRVAPAAEADMVGERRASADRMVRHQKRRAKAKAAKAQRKRNR